jgi:benzoate-CoA ligase family protein
VIAAERAGGMQEGSAPRRYNAAIDFVDRHLDEGRADKTAIRTLSGDWTYGQVAGASAQFAGGLAELGVGMEDRVLLLLLDGAEFVVSFFGAIRLGAVPVPVQTGLLPADYAHYLEDSRARVAVVSGQLADAIRRIRPDLSYLEHLVVVGEHGPDELAFAELVAASPSPPAATSPDDMAFWLYTSGTTGRPKGIVHLQHDLRFTAESYGRGVLQITEDDITFSVAKLYFAYGLGNALIYPFHAGAATALLADVPTADRILEVVRRLRPTLYFAVPSSYATLLAWVGGDFGSVRTFVSAGEPLKATILEQWRRRTGREILDGLGSSECCNIFISNRPGDARPDCAGKPVPGYEARIVDESGRDVSDGEVGELWMKGDSFFAFYWHQHELTKRTIQGEWVRTGDRCLRDAEGYIYYLGRGDDMMKVGGMWVSPLEVEQAINTHPCVRESAVVGRAGEGPVTRPEAFVVLNGDCHGGRQLENDLRRHARQLLPAFKCPREFHFVEALPRTTTGKLQRFRLREGSPRTQA